MREEEDGGLGLGSARARAGAGERGRGFNGFGFLFLFLFYGGGLLCVQLFLRFGFHASSNKKEADKIKTRIPHTERTKSEIDIPSCPNNNITPSKLNPTQSLYKKRKEINHLNHLAT